MIPHLLTNKNRRKKTENLIRKLLVIGCDDMNWRALDTIKITFLVSLMYKSNLKNNKKRKLTKLCIIDIHFVTMYQYIDVIYNL